MKRHVLAAACCPLLLAVLSTISPAHSQEVVNSIYGWPLGLTEGQTLRLQVVPAQPRMALPPSALGVCNVRISAEFLRAKDLVLLEATGPIDAGVNNSFTWDLHVQPGPPPSREEVIMKLTVERVPTRAVERSLLGVLCPLSGSLQIFDDGTGSDIYALPLDIQPEPDPG